MERALECLKKKHRLEEIVAKLRQVDVLLTPGTISYAAALAELLGDLDKPA